MPLGPVILNNTPLVCLWLLGQFDLLRQLYAEVVVPEAVWAEFLAVESTPRQQALQQAPWLARTQLDNPQSALVFAGLDRGESEVLALAIERQARLVVIDERRARSYAQRLQLPVTGTLGLLLAAKQKDLIPAVALLIEALQAAGLYFHPSLVAAVLELAAEHA